MLIKLTSIQKGTKYDFNWQRNDKRYFIILDEHQLSLECIYVEMIFIKHTAIRISKPILPMNKISTFGVFLFSLTVGCFF